MWSGKVFLILACILHSHSVLSIWTCTEDTECALPQGSVCQAGECVCPTGNQLVLGGTACAAAAPYLTSTCRDDLQCSNLLTSFQCRRDKDETEGQCDCQPGFHYFVGRCWKSADYGEVCERNEECFGGLRDPYNMACNEGRCTCADGYYERQRGECRRAGYAVGDGCILDEDCKFTNGACNPSTFTCINSASPTSFTPTIKMKTNVTSPSRSLSRSHGSACSAASPCPEPFLCSAFGICVCPRGYYPNTAGNQCFAELGSPATEAQCTGFLAVVQDGVCGCPANVYFDVNMRDCVKATRRITDSCVTDPMCHTFGAASICGPPDEDNWGIRNCECVPEQAVWDSGRNMCRLFAGIGETCVVDSDCMAGTQEIRCEQNELGQSVCTCPPDTVNIDGLCLTSGLSLGQECQMTQECTETEHTVCEGGVCSCGPGYEASGDICLPTIGSPCLVDAECVINNTVCLNAGGVSTCQCSSEFMEYNETCWPRLSHHTQACNVSLQCTEYLGSGSNCTNATCQCFEDHHFRDDRCWPKTGLFEPCSRSSECYLGELTDRVQCRNSLCQCSFYFPYSEAHHTCGLSHHTQACNVSLQCTEYLGSGSNCTNATCQCFEDHHFRDDRCWPKTGLFEPCSRSSECYLGDLTDRVQCRNSLCQCSFYYPYSEAHHTCAGPDGMVSSPEGSGSSVAVSSMFTIIAGLLYVMLH